MLNKRSKEKELMDLGQDFYTQEEYEHCLKKLFTINQLMGIFRHTVKLLKRFPKDADLVDVGCGGGLFLLNLTNYFPDMKMLGLDISEKAIHLAEKELERWKQKKGGINLSFQLEHQPELSLKQQSVDIILLTLVCHHVDDEDLIVFLKKANDIARKGLIINDLHRHPIAYWYYKFLSPLFRNRLIRHDGLISIEKGFTRKELERLLKLATIKNYRIKWCFPFRWSILILKS
ncbi:MAG: methyltransferase domain-containing protein [Tatlockia sp.]|nr:methyltransferase domain-containing protein [Tatlockia sp.]